MILRSLETKLMKLMGNFVLFPELSLFLLLILVFVSRMLVRALWERQPSPVWAPRIFTSFVVVPTSTSLGFCFNEVAHAAGHEQHPNAGAAGSGASDSAVASTPSSSFFRGLSGQIPAAPDSPEEVQQREQQPPLNLGDLPEVPMEHILEAPERDPAAGVEGPSREDVKKRLAEMLSAYGKRRKCEVYLSTLSEELKLNSSDQEDRLQLFKLMGEMRGDVERQKSEAGGLLVEEYSKYYKQKYNKSIYLK